MGSVGSVLFCVPILVNLRDVQPAWLFHETGTMTWTTGRLTLRNWVSYLPCLAAFWGLAIWQAKSFLVGSIFIGLFLSATVGTHPNYATYLLDTKHLSISEIKFLLSEIPKEETLEEFAKRRETKLQKCKVCFL